MFNAVHVPSLAFAVALTGAPQFSIAQSAVPVKAQVAPSGISYVSGGIGDAQQKAMVDTMQSYTLRLIFARPKSGDYVSDVKVRIDQEGKGSDKEQVLEVTSTGPMLFAGLPDGSYRVRAEYEGQTQTKAVSIRHDEPRELVYYFPER